MLRLLTISQIPKYALWGSSLVRETRRLTGQISCPTSNVLRDLAKLILFPLVFWNSNYGRSISIMVHIKSYIQFLWFPRMKNSYTRSLLTFLKYNIVVILSYLSSSFPSSWNSFSFSIIYYLRFSSFQAHWKTQCPLWSIFSLITMAHIFPFVINSYNHSFSELLP